MNHSARIAACSRLHLCSGLIEAGVPVAAAVRIALADLPSRGAGEGEAAGSPASLIPGEWVHTRALLAAAPDDAALLRSAAETIDAPGAPGYQRTVLRATVLVAFALFALVTFVFAPAYESMTKSFDWPMPPTTAYLFFAVRWIALPLALVVFAAWVAQLLLAVRPDALGPRATRLKSALDRLLPFRESGAAVRTRLAAGWFAATAGRAGLLARAQSLRELAPDRRTRAAVDALVGALKKGEPLHSALSGGAWLPGLSKVLQESAHDPEVAGPAALALGGYAGGVDFRAGPQLQRSTLVAQIVVSILVGLLVVSLYVSLARFSAMF